MWRKATVKHAPFSTVQLECKMRIIPFCSHWLNSSQGFQAANDNVPGC